MSGPGHSWLVIKDKASGFQVAILEGREGDNYYIHPAEAFRRWLIKEGYINSYTMFISPDLPFTATLEYDWGESIRIWQ